MSSLPPVVRPLTPKQVADRWQVSEKTIRNFANMGLLRHFKLGGKLLRIPVAAVEEFEQCNMRLVNSGEAIAQSTMTSKEFGTDIALELATQQKRRAA